MSSDQLASEASHRYVKMQSEPAIPRQSSFRSFRLREHHPRIFDGLPKAEIVSVSRPDAGDISPMLLTYTIDFSYKKFKWRLVKKASKVLYLHLILKKRALIEEFHEKQEQIGVLVEDKQFVDSLMDGKPWKEGKFSLSLRLSLWLEHLGLHGEEVSQIRDPIINSTHRDIWVATAKVRKSKKAAFRQSTSYWKEKLGHSTIDLGIAPEKLEIYQNGDMKGTDPMERLQSIRGHLVSLPLEFMCNEDLRPTFSEGEFYASSQVFY